MVKFMKNYSIWNEEKKVNLPSLQKDCTVDVAIIGGGLTGLSIGYQLKDTNFKTIILEQNECGRGVTSKSTAKITYLQEHIYHKIKRFGDEKKAQKYLESQREAVVLLKEIIEKEKIACDFESSPSYLFVTDEKNKPKLDKEYQFYKQNGVNITKTKLKNYPAIKVDDTYVFHPIKYINGLKKILKDQIYENSRVEKITQKENEYVLCVNGYTVKAKNVVLATHYPYFIYPFFFPLKNHVETSYVKAIKVSKPLKINGINLDKENLSFRFYKDYCLLLFHSSMSSARKNLRDNFIEKGEYNWTNKDVISNDYLPFIGKITKDDSFLIACGYNTWGFTNATLAGRIIKDILCKKKNKYSFLFDPKRRRNLNKFIRFFVDAGNTLTAILKSTKKNPNNQNVEYRKMKGKSVAVYIDENKKEHIVLNRCPHMKCGLVFNEVEKTWDCLCHGSRFDIDGKCLEGPSNQDISFDL